MSVSSLLNNTLAVRTLYLQNKKTRRDGNTCRDYIQNYNILLIALELSMHSCVDITNFDLVVQHYSPIRLRN